MLAQVRALFAAVGFGIFLGALYDVVRIFRILCGMPCPGGIPRRVIDFRFPLLPRDFATRKRGGVAARAHAVLLITTDFLYALTAGVLFCVFVYWQSNGVFRLYYLLAAIPGFFAYYMTVGRLVLASAGVIVFFMRAISAYLFLFVKIPLAFLFRLLWRVFLGIWYCFYTPLYAICAERRRLREAKRAFLPFSHKAAVPLFILSKK